MQTIKRSGWRLPLLLRQGRQQTTVQIGFKEFLSVVETQCLSYLEIDSSAYLTSRRKACFSFGALYLQTDYYGRVL